MKIDWAAQVIIPFLLGLVVSLLMGMFTRR